MNAANFVGGFAGALVLTAIHESVRQFVPQAPRVDLLGIRAIQGLLHSSNIEEPSKDTERQLALGGDLMANASYYSLAGRSYTKGALLGLAAGIGGLVLPGPLGLGEAPTNRSPLTQALTVGYYLAGGLVATAVTRALSHNKEKTNGKATKEDLKHLRLKKLANKIIH